METQTKITKVAWIRDPEPPGRPAPGHLKCCICNREIRCNFDAKQILVCCGCGMTYNGEGWILDQGKAETNMETINMTDCKYCFAVPGASSMIDVVNPATDKTFIYGKTLEESRQEKGYEKAELMTVDDFCAAKAARQDSPIAWTETSEEHFDEMLNVLPPACYSSGGFLVGEPYDHHATTGRPRFAAYREIGGRFFKSSRPMTVKEFKEIC